MIKLGKVSKRILIIGIGVVLVGFGLYTLNVNGIIPFMCILAGTLFAGVGTPYVNGIEQGAIRTCKENERNNELVSKRNYVINNLNKFKFVDNAPRASKDVYLVSHDRLGLDAIKLSNSSDNIEQLKTIKVKVKKRTRND